VLALASILASAAEAALAIRSGDVTITERESVHLPSGLLSVLRCVAFLTDQLGDVEVCNPQLAVVGGGSLLLTRLGSSA
jgi:hypothetical protein